MEDRLLYFCSVVSSSIFLSSFFLAYSQRSEIGWLPYLHTWCGLSVNLGCTPETWCTNVMHAARWKYRTHNSPKKLPSEHHRITLSGYIFAIKARIDNRKKMLNSNISVIMFSQYGKLRPTNGSGVWGTPPNVTEFRVLAALLHGTSSERQPNFAALNRGRHLYSAGRPSRWALAHILVYNRIWRHFVTWFLRGCIEITWHLLVFNMACHLWDFE